MIIRFDYLFSKHVDLTNPLSWDKPVFLLNHLIDAYLSFSWRPEWRPRAWVKASIAFFVAPLVSSDSMAQNGDRNLLNWLKNDFGIIDSSFTSDPSDPHMFVKLVRDSMVIQRKKSEKEEVLEFTYKFMISLLCGLSFTVAVLQNLYQHFKRILEEEQGETSERKREGLVLMQVQLVKMYDLRRNCLLVQQLFRTVSSQSNDITKKKSTKKKRGSQTVSRIQYFVFSHFYLPSDIWW
jgi:hypothetical protein